MTKDRALEVLSVYASVNGSGRCTQDEFEEAKKMAIEALSNSEIPNNSDCVSRQAAIDAPEAQERQRLAKKRRYTFGNDEFSLEAAYHDCKLVFDGITDDDSFQEADTGLILYYANEIIYALHEALEGKGVNVLSNDLISRQATIRFIRDKVSLSLFMKRSVDKADKACWELCEMLDRDLPSAKPEPQWIPCKDEPPTIVPCLVCLTEASYPRVRYCYDIYTYDTKKYGTFHVTGSTHDMLEKVARDEGRRFDIETLYQRRIIAWMALPEPYKGE